MTCIGEPISWLRLERHALDADAAVASHLDACEACRAAFETIEPISLPPLVARPKRAPWWTRWVYAGSFAAAAAAILLFVLARGADPRVDRIRVKGGDATVSIVRDRDGAITIGATTFRTSDRLKVRLTCPPSANGESYDADVIVYQDGAASHPLDHAAIACGNDVTVPGAFRLTSASRAKVCLAIAGQAGCVALSPEP